MFLDICVSNIRVGIRVRRFHLVCNGVERPLTTTVYKVYKYTQAPVHCDACRRELAFLVFSLFVLANHTVCEKM